MFLSVFRVNSTDFTIFRRKTLTKNAEFAKIEPVLTFLAIFREKCLTFIACSCIINANMVTRAKKTRRRETETEQRNNTVNQRINSSIAKKVTVDLPGPREMQHIRCASGPFVAPSRRVPVRLDAQRGGFTPPYTHRR